jgi:hypothetical protein
MRCWCFVGFGIGDPPHTRAKVRNVALSESPDSRGVTTPPFVRRPLADSCTAGFRLRPNRAIAGPAKLSTWARSHHGLRRLSTSTRKPWTSPSATRNRPLWRYQRILTIWPTCRRCGRWFTTASCIKNISGVGQNYRRISTLKRAWLCPQRGWLPSQESCGKASYREPHGIRLSWLSASACRSSGRPASAHTVLRFQRDGHLDSGAMARVFQARGKAI